MNPKERTYAKLRFHGGRVIRQISKMVCCLQEGNDEEIMTEIMKVPIFKKNCN